MRKEKGAGEEREARGWEVIWGSEFRKGFPGQTRRYHGGLTVFSSLLSSFLILFVRFPPIFAFAAPRE